MAYRENPVLKNLLDITCLQEYTKNKLVKTNYFKLTLILKRRIEN